MVGPDKQSLVAISLAIIIVITITTIWLKTKRKDYGNDI